MIPLKFFHLQAGGTGGEVPGVAVTGSGAGLATVVGVDFAGAAVPVGLVAEPTFDSVGEPAFAVVRGSAKVEEVVETADALGAGFEARSVVAGR